MKEIIPGPWPFRTKNEAPQLQKRSPLRTAGALASGLAIMGAGGGCIYKAVDQYMQPYGNNTIDYALGGVTAELLGGLIVTDAIRRRREKNKQEPQSK